MSRPPRSGKGLYAWAKQADTDCNTGTQWLDWVVARGSKLGFPKYTGDWDKDQVDQVWEMVVKAVESQRQRAAS